MKNNQVIYGFLTEFLVMIFVFSLISIVTVTLFSRADSLDESTAELNHKLLLSENVAEMMKSYNGEDLDEYLSDFDLENLEVTVVEVNGMNTLYQTTIRYMKDDKSHIELKVSSIGVDTHE